MIAGGPRGDRLPGRGRAHVVDAQVDRRGAGGRVRVAHHRRPAAGIHQRRDRAAMDDTGLRVADDAGVIGHDDPRIAVADLFDLHAQHAGMRAIFALSAAKVAPFQTVSASPAFIGASCDRDKGLFGAFALMARGDGTVTVPVCSGHFRGLEYRPRRSAWPTNASASKRCARSLT